MAIINFPTSPVDGQQYTAPNGVAYTYSTAVGAWLLDSNGGGSGGGTVTGVTASAPLASSGGASPNISLTGTVPVANGGTGATTQAGAQANLLPAQTAPDAGKFLQTDGAGVVSWAAAGGGGFASGTTMLFYQAAAPTGWTQVTTQNDKALRVVSGAGGGSGGTTPFSVVFTSRTATGTVDNTTLTIAQMPSHDHGQSGNSVLLVGSGLGNYSGWSSSKGAAGQVQVGGTGFPGTSTGGGGAHTHGFTGSSLDFAVQYIDVIIASKN
jgi:hypothetical protein